MSKEKKRISPWAWVPSLYFAEGIPYVVVMSVAVIMYKKMGLSNTDIALYTSWLYLPWVIKPFWSPFVDLLKTKRWWIITMQLLVGAGLAGIAFTIPTDFFFQATLAFFWLIGFSSATHDIAADGFYMLALDSHQQAFYVGIRSTFYRVASITGQGILIILAGALEAATGLDPAQIEVQAGPQYANEIRIPEQRRLTAADTSGDLHFVVSPAVLQIGTNPIPKDSALYMKEYAELQNLQNGFILPERSASAKKQDGDSWWSRHIADPLGNFIQKHFGDTRSAGKAHELTGASGIVQVALSKPPAEGEKIVLNTSFTKGDNSIFLAHGDRIEFTSRNWDKPAYLVVQLDPKLKHEAVASFKGLSGNINFSWSITFFVLAGMFIAFCLYHKFILPRPASDHPTGEGNASSIFREFFETFATFFRKPQVVPAILFMLLYRFPEAQLIKLITPFLIDPREAGGLGLTTGQVGLVYGTVGVVGLTIGGIIGGIVAARGGLKKWLWPMAWSISLTCATFVYLGYFQPQNLFVINLCVFIEQFGYGFGFTAYMLYLIYFSEGEHKTAHYAICTAFMALGMMLPGMAAGWLQEHIGYEHFFYWVMICCAATILVTAFLKIDPNFGRKDAGDKA